MVIKTRCLNQSFRSPISTLRDYLFVKRELFTPACSHFLIIGLKNDIGSAVKTANEITSIKSVVKWFIPKSVPASQSQGNAEANKLIGIKSLQGLLIILEQRI